MNGQNPPDAPRFPLLALARHRLQTDGAGVTTLVAARGCPLRCKMCLNPQALRDDTPVRFVDAQALYELVKIDDLYFRATNGGVTFGGGEPLLYADFIAAFRDRCGDAWRITAETCLNVPEENLRTALRCVDAFLVDIKDIDPEIYRRYTGADNARVLQNLRALLRAFPARVTVRVPRIPGYNTGRDVQNSVRALRDMGAQSLDVFTYRVK